jgi:hypothetical protein
MAKIILLFIFAAKNESKTTNQCVKDSMLQPPSLSLESAELAPPYGSTQTVLDSQGREEDLRFGFLRGWGV